MRLGEMVGGHTSRLRVGDYIEIAKDLETRGFDTMWIPHVFGHDGITLSALVGHETERIELATAVVPTYPRHPVAIAQQSLTAAAASRGRFTLGIGLSHPPVIERMHGLSYARRASHMAEYMSVVGPLLRGEAVSFEGQEYRVQMSVEVEDAYPVPVILAALGPRMLELAGRETAGTLLWMVGFRAIEEYVVPTITKAANAAGNSDIRIAAGMHIVLTEKPDAANAHMEETLQQYKLMPSYAANIEREGSLTPADFSIIGDEKALDAGLDRLRDIGVTDFDANIIQLESGDRERTLEYLQSRL